MKHDYFVSYSSGDRERADELVCAIEAMGARCFIDHRDITPGCANYRDAIVQGIRNCERILVLLSDGAQASDEVTREVQVAHDARRRRTPVWLDEPTHFSNGALESMLNTSQWVVWGGRPVAEVARSITAAATVSSLRAGLSKYESVTTALRLNLKPIFDLLDDNDNSAALVKVEVQARMILGQLWGRYYPESPPPPEALEDLVAGCRDRFEHASMLSGFATILRSVQQAREKPPTLEKVVEAVESLMALLSVLRVQRWGLEELAPNVGVQARFLTGLMVEAGWLQGKEIVPNPDVAYMLFERSVGNTTKYLEILLGADEQTVRSIADESAGRIMEGSSARLKSRFLILDDKRGGEIDEWPEGFLTPDQFVLRFTGVTAAHRFPRASVGGAGKIGLESEVEGAVAAGDRNVLVYGPPGTGKSRTLRRLVAEGWEGAPPIRFYVDYAEADESSVDTALDDQLSAYFPQPVRHRTRELVSYLVRSGHAALILDSIECAAAPDSPSLTAHTLARLCAFLSQDSTVILAGRDAALRDSSAVREFFMDAPALSDQLAQVLRSAGIDSTSLPNFRMVRARRTREWQSCALTDRDRLVDTLSSGIWQVREDDASSALRDALASTSAADLVNDSVPLGQALIGSIARGNVPMGVGEGLDLPHAGIRDVLNTRVLREFRAAVDYVRAATRGGPVVRWHDVSVGETARRLVRLLSILLPDGQPHCSQTCLSLVGPPSAVVAIHHAGPAPMAATTVTAGQYQEFLRVLPDLDPSTLVADLEDEGILQPYFERAPKNPVSGPRQGLLACGRSQLVGSACVRRMEGRSFADIPRVGNCRPRMGRPPLSLGR